MGNGGKGTAVRVGICSLNILEKEIGSSEGNRVSVLKYEAQTKRRARGSTRHWKHHFIPLQSQQEWHHAQPWHCTPLVLRAVPAQQNKPQLRCSSETYALFCRL